MTDINQNVALDALCIIVRQPLMTRFGHNLRSIRERAALTQDALAARLGFKKPAPISIWENSDLIPQPKTIQKLAKALGCTTADLLAGVVTPYDALRGSLEVISEDLRVTDDEQDLIREWRRLPAEQKQHLREVIAALVKYLRRAGPGRRRPSSGSTTRSPAGAPPAGRARPPQKKKH